MQGQDSSDNNSNSDNDNNININSNSNISNIPPSSLHVDNNSNNLNNDSTKADQLTQQQKDLLRGQKIAKCFKQNSYIQQFQKKNIDDVLNGVDLHIENYNKHRWPQIFQMTIKCNASYITFRNNQSQTILKQIKHINFDNLSILYLHDNQIDNLQALYLCDFKHLEDLALDRNHISRVKCMHKWLNVSHLTWFSLDNNPISQLYSLSKMNMKQEQFRYIRVQTGSKFLSNHQDLSILVKLRTKSLNLISICRKIRIKQDKMEIMIHSKYPAFMIC